MATMLSTRILVFVITAACAFSIAVPWARAQSVAAQPAAYPIRYKVAPLFKDGALAAVSVEVVVIANPDGKTTIELPDRWGGVGGHYRFLSPLIVEGGTVSTVSATARLITSPPGARLKLHYTVTSAYDHEPSATDSNLYAGVVVRPDWFEGLGDLFLVIVKDRDFAPARIVWQRWPRNWTTVGSEDSRSATVADVLESSFLAGKDVQMRRRAIPGGTLRFASHGAFGWSLDDYVDQLTKTISAQRTFWRDSNGDYTAMLIKLAASPNHYSAGGTGRKHGFVQYASPGVEQALLFHNISHEHLHNWIPKQIGELPDDASGASAFWLSEGFTDFYTARTLLKAGLWSPQQFVDNLNNTLFRLATSKVRNASNAQIARDFWTDNAVEQLPYDRGHLFAYLLSHALSRGGKPNLDSVLFAMRARWQAAPVDGKPMLDANLFQALSGINIDAQPLIQRFIEQGEAIVLPEDMLGMCAMIRPTTEAMYDPGYDRDATIKAGGVIASVRTDGPAYAAGLRTGMKRLEAISGSFGDSRVMVTLKVRDGMKIREISYFPRGSSLVPSQRVTLNPGLTPDQLRGCARTMGAF